MSDIHKLLHRIPEWKYCVCTTPPVYHGVNDRQCDNCHTQLARLRGFDCTGYKEMAYANRDDMKGGPRK